MTFGFRVERSTSAPPERVYDVLADVAAFREWAPLFRYAELIRPGTPDPLGAGAVRRLGPVKRATVDDEIVEARPPHYQRYIGVRGFPVAQYRGEIRLSPVESGTQLLWTVTFEQKVPGTGRPLTACARTVATR